MLACSLYSIHRPQIPPSPPSHSAAVGSRLSDFILGFTQIGPALRDLHRMGLPAVVPLGVVTERTDPDGEPLPACLLKQCKATCGGEAAAAPHQAHDAGRVQLDAAASLQARDIAKATTDVPFSLHPPSSTSWCAARMG